MKEIVFIGGRSSAGKESLMAALLHVAGNSVIADCSLEYNALLKILQPAHGRENVIPLPYGFCYDEENCTHCMKCLGICHQHALESKDGLLVFHEFRCTHCGSCVKWCPVMALSQEEGMTLGYSSASTRMGPVVYTSGYLDPGFRPDMLRAILLHARQLAADRRSEFLMINGSRGLRNTSGIALEKANAVIAITSPSFFAARDLEGIIRFSRRCGQEPLVIINMADLDPRGTGSIEAVCDKLSASVIARVPFHRGFQEALKQRMAITEYAEAGKLDDFFLNICDKIRAFTAMN